MRLKKRQPGNEMLYGYITNTNEPPKYDDIQNSDLSREDKVKQIQYRTKAYQDDLDRQLHKDYARIGFGSALSGASFHPIFNIPYVGTGIGGAMYDLGQGIVEGDTAGDLWNRTKRGFAIGETVGAIPYVGRGLGKTKAGHAVLRPLANGWNKFAQTPFMQKAEDILISEFAPVQKFTNPWYVDTLQKGHNPLKYVYETKTARQNNAKMASELYKTPTSEIIRNLRMEGSMPNGRGAYTQRSYRNPKNGVVAQYYPTKELKKNFALRDFEASKYNELIPNNEETAQLYFDTLKGVKDRFGKTYDTVSLHPVDEYKNMRLFLSPDKTSGFAIKPDGDIVSVFGSKEGSGTSHSMLELALQNKGSKLDNYDVPRLRNIYENHGFNVTERAPWDDAYWKPSEWDKNFMLKEYGVAEPDITFREIYDKNIYPEIKKTSLYEKIMDALN